MLKLLLLQLLLGMLEADEGAVMLRLQAQPQGMRRGLVLRQHLAALADDLSEPRAHVVTRDDKTFDPGWICEK